LNRWAGGFLTAGSIFTLGAVMVSAALGIVPNLVENE
jgi:hypothetical protein